MHVKHVSNVTFYHLSDLWGGVFRQIIDEVKKYGQLKAEIRSGARKAHAAVQLDEETKNSLIKQGREEARASLI